MIFFGPRGVVHCFIDRSSCLEMNLYLMISWNLATKFQSIHDVDWPVQPWIDIPKTEARSTSWCLHETDHVKLTIEFPIQLPLLDNQKPLIQKPQLHDTTWPSWKIMDFHWALKKNPMWMQEGMRKILLPSFFFWSWRVDNVFGFWGRNRTLTQWLVEYLSFHSVFSSTSCAGRPTPAWPSTPKRSSLWRTCKLYGESSSDGLELLLADGKVSRVIFSTMSSHCRSFVSPCFFSALLRINPLFIFWS